MRMLDLLAQLREVRRRQAEAVQDEPDQDEIPEQVWRVQPAADLWPIGYYGSDAVPILGALARSYTTFDRYFNS